MYLNSSKLSNVQKCHSFRTSLESLKTGLRSTRRVIVDCTSETHDSLTEKHERSPSPPKHRSLPYDQAKRLVDDIWTSPDPTAKVRSLMAKHPRNPQFIIAAAKLAIKLGDHAGARSLFQRAAEADSPGEAYLQWAVWEQKQHNLDKARALLDRSMELGRPITAARSANARSKLEEKAGNLSLAESYLIKALEFNPRHTVSLQGLAVFYARKGDNKKAIESFRKASIATPTHAPIWQAWGEYEASRGRFEAARQRFQAGADKCPQDKRYVQLLGAWARMEARRRNLLQARRLYRLALDIDPDDMHSIMELGQLEARNNKTEEAKELYEHGLSKDPCNFHLLSSLAHLYSQLREWEASQQTWERLVELDPGNGFACAALGTFSRREGDMIKAEMYYRRGLGSRGKGGALCHEALAQLMEFDGRIKEAREMFSVGHGLCPESGRLLREWAAFEKRQGDLTVASRLYRKGAEVDPADERLWLQWAFLERRRGDDEGAINCAIAGTQASPKNPCIWQLLGTLYSSQGMMPDARAAFKNGIKQCPSNAPLHLEWALAEREAGNAEQALDILRKGAKLGEGHVPLLAAWVRVAKEMGLEEEMKEADSQLKAVEVSLSFSMTREARKKRRNVPRRLYRF
jgi:tetratricopeptide (TPR) repeat protein